VLAVSSLYGIDILEDNVGQCRKRLFELFDQVYIESMIRPMEVESE